MPNPENAPGRGLWPSEQTPAELLKAGMFRRNPVLVRALALAPVLVVSTKFKNGLLLATVTFLVLTLMGAVSSLLYRRLPAFLRAAVLTLIAAAITTPLCMLAGFLAPNVAAEVGIFLPLVAVNGIILSRAERYGSGAGVLPSAVDGAANGLGFALAILVMSAVREAVGSGTFYDRALPGLQGTGFNIALYPAGGLLILACLIAAVQYFRRKRAERPQRAVQKDGE